MSTQKNHQILLASRPVGEPTDDNFKYVESSIPSPGDNEVLLRAVYLSLDPYMRGRMSDAKSYAEPVAIGDVMEGGVVAQVVESKHPNLAAGDYVHAYTGWQEFAVANGNGLRKVDASLAPLDSALGVLGMPGLTAYIGLMKIGKPKAGETVVVSAASGAVGSVVGQIAKIHGCRVVGIAGVKEKCDYVVNELGFDACLSHKSKDLGSELKSACPNGIDVYFENVGGAVFSSVMPLLNTFARVPVCGLISQYNATELPPGPNQLPLLMRDVLTKSLTVQGFIVSNYFSELPEFATAMSGWLQSGKMKYKTDIVEGLENAPKAFQGLLRGENFGKLIVKVSAEG